MSLTNKPTKIHTYQIHYLLNGKTYFEEYDGKRLSFFQVGDGGAVVFQIISPDGDEVFTCGWESILSVKIKGMSKDLRKLKPAEVLNFTPTQKKNVSKKRKSIETKKTTEEN